MESDTSTPDALQPINQHQVTVKMEKGSITSSFNVKSYNLPQCTATKLT